MASLALTLPKQSSDTDDGLLTASEVAQLKLNADWVVLSAGKTIAGDKPGAEALSGLARGEEMGNASVELCLGLVSHPCFGRKVELLRVTDPPLAERI